MADPITVLGLSGSLRQGSYNTALLRVAAKLAPEGMQVDVVTPHGIPFYDGDVEAEGIPEPVMALKERLAASDALLIATPEYNSGYPGVLKNAMDWLSRPPADVPRLFRDRPVAVIGATPGAFGTALAQSAWLPVLRALRMRIFAGPPIRLSRAHEAFDDGGRLRDEAMRKELAAFLDAFAAFLRRA